MPVYEYTALDASGKKYSGIIDAASAFAARQKLRETNYFPVDLQESAAGDKTDLSVRSVGSIFRRVGPVQVATVTRQLSTLLNAGLPLIPSLSVLVNQSSNQELKKVLAQIRADVNEGNSLSQSISHFPRVFPPYYINMVRAGEVSGMIHVVLERLADFSERQQALKLKIRTALAYPLFMLLVGSAIVLFLITFVVPNITKVFEEMHQKLPLITVILITASRFLQSFWWILGIIVAGALAAANYLAANTAQGRRVWDGLKLKVPLFGPINRKLAVARFARTLGTLLQSGVPLLSSLDIVKNIVNNVHIAGAVQAAANEIREGESVSAPLAKSRLFPPIATEMIAIGEQSGNLETMLYRIADAYEKEVESSVSIMTSVLEPLMILGMGIVVGFIVLSVLLPIFEMNQLVR